MYNDSLQTIMAVSTGGVPFVSQSIPKYAKGGIVYHRQIAEVGEDGLEGIVPLEGGAIPVRFTGGGSNRPISINVKIGNREIKDFIIETTDDVNAKVNRRGGYPGRV